jgi:flagellar hook-associated protein 1 FlgK
MAGIIGNGLTALLASQRALQTVGNNIANANTEGYVRQRVNFAENPSQAFGYVSFGSGVRIAGLERLYDQLLTTQYQEASSMAARADAFNGIAARTDRLLGNPDTGINASIQRFFDKVEAVNRDPTSVANRQQLLIEGEALAGRFADLTAELDTLGRELDARLRQSVDFVNRTAAQIATLNEHIVASGINPPPDLLDQRDLLVRQLGDQIDVRTNLHPDGSLSVYTGSGQSLVLGTRVNRLEVATDSLDPTRLEVAIRTGDDVQEISGRITGGTIGGLLAARADVLEPARLQLAQLAVGLATAVNEQHRQGMDTYGDLGGDFFRVEPPRVIGAPANTGTATVSALVADASALEPREYELRYAGGAWSLYDAATSAPVAMTGTGTPADPFTAGGRSIVVNGAAADGDRFLVRPLVDSTRNLGLALSDPARIAAASPLATAANLANLSDAGIAPATVSNVTHPDLRAGATITFVDPDSYTIQVGATVSGPFAYTSGADISFAGWTTRITGTPAAGDSFTVSAAPPGSADNSNALALAAIPRQGYFLDGRQSFSDLGSDLVASVGSMAARASQDLSARESIRHQAELDLQSLSGVNLDEEAADLLKYQEAYQAAARLIAVGDELFRTILAVVSR